MRGQVSNCCIKEHAKHYAGSGLGGHYAGSAHYARNTMRGHTLCGVTHYAGSGLELLHQRACATSDHSPSITFTPLRNNKEPGNLVHSDLGITTHYAGSGLELLHQRVCATSAHPPSITFTPLRNNKEPGNLVHSDLGMATSLVHFCDVYHTRSLYVADAFILITN